MTDKEQPAPQCLKDCLVDRIDGILAVEPALEAVKIRPSEQRVSFATLGKPDTAALERQLAAQIGALQDKSEGSACGFLQGGASCSHCERPDARRENARFTVEQSEGAITVSRVTCPTAPSLWRWRELPWPKWVPRKPAVFEDAEHLDEWKWQMAAASICGVLALAAHLVPEPAWALGLFIGAYIAGASFPLLEVWERLQKRVLDVHFLMLAVAAGSASIGAWSEGAVLLFLFSLSSALEHFAMARTHREIESLIGASPKVATVLGSNREEIELPVEELRPGLRVLIRPESLVPVDAEVVQGTSAADESTLTGEAIPVRKEVGDTVLAGTLNLWGALEAVALRPAQESALQKIIRLIEQAQKLKAPVQRFTDRFGTKYTYAVLGLSFVMFFVWWLGAGLNPFRSGADPSAFYRAMTLLVVSSPCALVLSIPSAILAAIAWGARRGILFRGGAAVEKLADVQAVALDKTGTLTTGELKVEKVESFPPGREAEIERWAYSVERLSSHPLARAVTRYGKQRGIAPIAFDHYESFPGLGLVARREGETCCVGHRSLLESRAERPLLKSLPPSGPGTSEVWVSAGPLVGRIILRDDIRPQARSVIAGLRKEHLRTLVLTGDRRASALHFKEQLGLDDVRFELRPEQKVAAVKELADRGVRVAMIGDGVNDAPCLAAAYVGVAMGARGSDAALEQAEVVLMHDRLEGFIAAFHLSRRARLIIRQNLVISLGAVGILVGLALFGSIPLTLGVLGHEGSTVLVVLNSLRLLFGKEVEARAQGRAREPA